MEPARLRESFATLEVRKSWHKSSRAASMSVLGTTRETGLILTLWHLLLTARPIVGVTVSAAFSPTTQTQASATEKLGLKLEANAAKQFQALLAVEMALYCPQGPAQSLVPFALLMAQSAAKDMSMLVDGPSVTTVGTIRMEGSFAVSLASLGSEK